MDLAYTPGKRSRTYNILLVVVDDLRARQLSAGGYRRETTPLLSARLPSATYFRGCHSPVGWTLPGCASIVTGQYPDDHGLFDHNQKFRQPKIGHYLSEYYRFGIGNNGNVVTDSIPRETLERLGFERRPAKWKFFGWDDGFDRYEWHPREDDDPPFESACAFLDEMNGGGTARRHGAREGRPWFFFFHTNVVHDYHLERPYYLDVRRWVDDDLHPGLRSFRDGPEIWRDPPDGIDEDEQIRQIVAKYDAGIYHADRKLEAIFRRVDFDDTIVVFASDHGEGFEPSIGRVHHCGRLHGDLTHVPLAIWLPPELHARYDPPAIEERACSTIDIVPTLLTLLGDPVAGLPGKFLYDLPQHRMLEGQDRGYIYWNEDCVRESYDTARIHITSEFTYPIKHIRTRKNDTTRESAYNLAYDPEEHDNLAEALPVPLRRKEPISFVVAVNDEEELRNNLLLSPVARSRDHEWLFIDNPDNSRFDSISALYQHAMRRAEHELVFFVHQDVYLPPGWEERMFLALEALEDTDPEWGVVGAVGALPPDPDRPKQLKGRWCDPSGYHYYGPLPHEVQSLDEQWLGVKKSSGVGFDPALPGFHCYGMDLSLTAREKGLKTYALDAFVWHKYRDSSGHLVSCRDDSDKIRRRWSDEFMAEFQPSADYVEEKWRKYLPFQTTSWNWDAD